MGFYIIKIRKTLLQEIRNQQGKDDGEIIRW
jgi:hypothetical protein